MKDNELATWRQEWHSQPSVPIDLIRKVERQTMHMKLERVALIVPILIGVGAIILAAVLPSIPSIVFAIGVWVFILVGLRFQSKIDKDVWAPAAETTAAYVDLSIVRCHRQLQSIRYFYVFAPLLTVFVMVGTYAILADLGALQTARDYVITIGGLVWGAAVVAMVARFMVSTGRKTRVELDYLMELQRKFGAADQRISE